MMRRAMCYSTIAAFHQQRTVWYITLITALRPGSGSRPNETRANSFRSGLVTVINNSQGSGDGPGGVSVCEKKEKKIILLDLGFGV